MSAKKYEAQRGQAVVETAVFLPFFLIVLFAILYFGIVGVKQERAQSAIHYGVATLPAQTIKIEQMYAAYNGFSGTTHNVPMPPLTPGPCPASAISQTQLAVNQAQTYPTSAPSAQPYWQMPSPTVTCLITFLPTSNVEDMYNVDVEALNETANQLTGTVPAPAYLTNLLPHSFPINAYYAAYLPLTLDEIIACTIFGGGGHGTTQGDGLADSVAGALGPSTNNQGQNNWPYYGGYNPQGFNGGGGVCNTG